MAIEFVLEVNRREGAQTVVNALDAYKAMLRASIQRTRRNLSAFEQRYGVTTAVFLRDMAHRPPLAAREHKHTPDEITFALPPTLEQVIDEIPTT